MLFYFTREEKIKRLQVTFSIYYIINWFCKLIFQYSGFVHEPSRLSNLKIFNSNHVKFWVKKYWIYDPTLASRFNSSLYI